MHNKTQTCVVFTAQQPAAKSTETAYKAEFPRRKHARPSGSSTQDDSLAAVLDGNDTLGGDMTMMTRRSCC